MKFPETLAGHRPRADYDEDEEEPGYFPVTFSPVKAGIFNLYLFQAITSTKQFIPFIEALNAASENDLVVVHLSTPGGSLDATDTFLTALAECDGRVVVRATGGVHSAGSVILLAADEYTLSENFNMLIHNGSCGAFGDFNKFAAHARANQAYMENFMRTTYCGFLTDEEIEQVIEGKDFWLGPAEFCARWEKRNKYMQALVDEVTPERQQIKRRPKRPRKPKTV